GAANPTCPANDEAAFRRFLADVLTPDIFSGRPAEVGLWRGSTRSARAKAEPAPGMGTTDFRQGAGQGRIDLHACIFREGMAHDRGSNHDCGRTGEGQEFARSVSWDESAQLSRDELSDRSKFLEHRHGAR